MKDPVIFICDTCFERNKQKLGTPGFEVLEYRLEDMRDVFAHINKGHSVYAEVARTVQTPE